MTPYQATNRVEAKTMAAEKLVMSHPHSHVDSSRKSSKFLRR